MSRDLSRTYPSVSIVLRAQPHLEREGEQVLVREHVPSILEGFYPAFPPGVDWKGHSGMTDTDSSLSPPHPTPRLHDMAWGWGEIMWRQL